MGFEFFYAVNIHPQTGTSTGTARRARGRAQCPRPVTQPLLLFRREHAAYLLHHAAHGFRSGWAGCPLLQDPRDLLGLFLGQTKPLPKLLGPFTGHDLSGPLRMDRHFRRSPGTGGPAEKIVRPPANASDQIDHTGRGQQPLPPGTSSR